MEDPDRASPGDWGSVQYSRPVLKREVRNGNSESA